jgi:hypothetical protein
MVEQCKSLKLGVVGWRAFRKALGFFGHVTGQASGWCETESTPTNYKFNSTLRSIYAG